MIHSDAKTLRERGEKLFSQKATLDSRNQEIADHFYPMRADFTITRHVGADYAEHLMTGYPAMVSRDLANSLGSMLRPRGQHWFRMTAGRNAPQDVGHDARAWLEWATGVQRRAMTDRASMFTRATKEGDHDFANFGGAVISTEMNRRDNALLYRCWHLRDVAWAEDSFGQIGEVFRVWKCTAAELLGLFPKAGGKLAEKAEKEPHGKVKAMHCVIRADAYGRKMRTPWVSLWIDCTHDAILEERGSWTPIYTIPRWATIAGSQYPYSPAALIALPDARLVQAMTLTLLEAGEKAVNPPMIGVASAFRGDLNLYPGGFTAVDAEYDERLGEVLRPLTQDKSGLPFGVEMADRTSAMIREAFYLNSLTLPQSGPQMTAYEVGQRVQEYIRQAMPLFEPMEAEYNGALCEITFETLLREGAFGPLDNIPRELRGGDVTFAFESPLSEAAERAKGQLFLEAKAILAEAVAVDPASAQIMDFGSTLRDTLEGIGVPAKWMVSEEEIAANRAADAQQQEAAALLGGMQQGADVAATLGAAARDFASAA